MKIKRWDQLWIETLPTQKLVAICDVCRRMPGETSIQRGRCRRIEAEVERRDEALAAKLREYCGNVSGKRGGEFGSIENAEVTDRRRSDD